MRCFGDSGARGCLHIPDRADESQFGPDARREGGPCWWQGQSVLSSLQTRPPGAVQLQGERPGAAGPPAVQAGWQLLCVGLGPSVPPASDGSHPALFPLQFCSCVAGEAARRAVLAAPGGSVTLRRQAPCPGMLRRVAPGCYLPGAPSDPYVRDYRIRLLKLWVCYVQENRVNWRRTRQWKSTQYAIKPFPRTFCLIRPSP